MTVSYSLEVANVRFYGFSRLLFRWKGSIYRLLYKEFLVFCGVYVFFSIFYRWVQWFFLAYSIYRRFNMSLLFTGSSSHQSSRICLSVSPFTVISSQTPTSSLFCLFSVRQNLTAMLINQLVHFFLHRCRFLCDPSLHPLVGSVYKLPAAWQPDDGGVRERPRCRREGSSPATNPHEIRQPVICANPALHQHKSLQTVPYSGACCWGG